MSPDATDLSTAPAGPALGAPARLEGLFSGAPAAVIPPVSAVSTSTAAPVRRGALARALAFPNPVNEYAARSTAGIVVVLSLLVLAIGLTTGTGWGLAVIAVGFWLRVAGGPRYSPAGRLAVHVIAPRLGAPRLVAGPPKRFAQGIGAVVSTTAAILFAAGLAPAAWVALGILIVAASFEALAGFCLGCWIFGRLQLAGLVPASVCEACSDLALRRA